MTAVRMLSAILAAVSSTLSNGRINAPSRPRPVPTTKPRMPPSSAPLQAKMVNTLPEQHEWQPA